MKDELRSRIETYIQALLQQKADLEQKPGCLDEWELVSAGHYRNHADALKYILEVTKPPGA